MKASECHFLFPKEKVTKENSRLCLILLKLVVWLGLCNPNQPMPDFEVIHGLWFYFIFRHISFGRNCLKTIFHI